MSDLGQAVKPLLIVLTLGLACCDGAGRNETTLQATRIERSSPDSEAHPGNYGPLCLELVNEPLRHASLLASAVRLRLDTWLNGRFYDLLDVEGYDVWPNVSTHDVPSDLVIALLVEYDDPWFPNSFSRVRLEERDYALQLRDVILETGTLEMDTSHGDEWADAVLGTLLNSIVFSAYTWHFGDRPLTRIRAVQHLQSDYIRSCPLEGYGGKGQSRPSYR